MRHIAACRIVLRAGRGMHTAKGAMEGDGETATAPSQETEDNWVATQEGRESALASPAPEDRESESDEYENTGEGAW